MKLGARHWKIDGRDKLPWPLDVNILEKAKDIVSLLVKFELNKNNFI